MADWAAMSEIGSGSTPRTMAGLLPAAAVVVEASPEMWDPAGLLPDELAAVAGAADGRRREFAAGRLAGRAALDRLGLPPSSIGAAPDRAPIWPERVVGSITHCRGYCAAAVARAWEIAALGIDAEPEQALPDGVERLVCTEAERRWIAARRPSGVEWGLVVFSAKESFYKAWRPLAGSWLDYRQAELELDVVAGSFAVRPMVPVPPAAAVLGRGEGRFTITGGRILTAFSVPASDP